MKGRVQDKVAIITGAGNGIGRATAILFSSQGGKVIVTDIDEQAARLTASYITEAGGIASAVPHDVADEKSWQMVFEHTVSEYGQLDVLVNNAGIAFAKKIADCSLDEFRTINDVNLHGTFIGCKGAIEVMRKLAPDGQPAIGSIINMSSMAGHLAFDQFAAYCTSKAAITNMCNALGVELGEAGDQIRMNSVHPGPVKTSLTKALRGYDYFDDISNFSVLPLQTYAEVDDVAYAVLYLASDESRLVTGSHMNVDGGTTAGMLAEI